MVGNSTINNTFKGNSTCKYQIWWRVGNGQKIKIWTDKWLPSSYPSTFKVTSPLNLLEEHARVCELINCDRGESKAQLVKSVFFSPEAETILVILISSTLPEDSTIWNATPNVKFLVMSAYKLAMDLRQQVERGCSSNDGA